MALMLFVGRRVIPWLLGQVARTGSRELFMLAVLAVALGDRRRRRRCCSASRSRWAPSWPAWSCSESDFSHEAAADALPLQDAFAVLFFVSVGMLFDPSILVRASARADRGRR